MFERQLGQPGGTQIIECWGGPANGQHLSKFFDGVGLLVSEPNETAFPVKVHVEDRIISSYGMSPVRVQVETERRGKRSC